MLRNLEFGKRQTSQSLPEPIRNALRQLDFAELSRHKLLGLAVSRGNFAFSRDEDPEIAQSRLLGNARREALANALLAEIARHSTGLEIGLLKGPALWCDLYLPGEREANDLDLHVSENEREPLLEVLRGLGFETFHRSRTGISNFKTVCIGRRFGDFSVEVHTKLWWREPSGFAWSWRPSLQPFFRRLEIEDQLLHLCGHWVAQHTMISLHWLIDIALFLETHGPRLDEQLLTKRARDLRLSRSLEVARAICRDLLQDVNATSLCGIDFEFLRDPRAKRLRYYLIKHLVQDSLGEAALYDLLWLASAAGERILSRVRSP